MPYSDRFTWAKYGHHILYSGIIPTNNSVAEVDIASHTNSFALVATHNINLTATHRECLILFLQTDPGNAASFGVDTSIHRRINDFLKNIFRSFTKGKDKGNFFDQIWEKNMISVASSIGDIAKEATKSHSQFSPIYSITGLRKVISGINVGTIAAVLHPT